MIETTVIESKALNSEVIVNVIKADSGEINNLLILLHGHMYPESSEELFYKLPQELDLEGFCARYHAMVVIPLMLNRYYISTEDYDCSSFVAYELSDYVKQKYALPHSIEMTLAGISMGGYGATLVAANTGAFMKVISISGAFIVKDIEIGSPSVWGRSTPTSIGKDAFQYYFLPLSDLAYSTTRNALAALQLFEKRGDHPKFVVACGTEDGEYERNLAFMKELERHNINYVFDRVEGGGHESECFKLELWRAMEL